VALGAQASPAVAGRGGLRWAFSRALPRPRSSSSLQNRPVALDINYRPHAVLTVPVTALILYKVFLRRTS
jgi:hypothetical protein